MSTHTTKTSTRSNIHPLEEAKSTISLETKCQILANEVVKLRFTVASREAEIAELTKKVIDVPAKIGVSEISCQTDYVVEANNKDYDSGEIRRLTLLIKEQDEIIKQKESVENLRRMEQDELNKGYRTLSVRYADVEKDTYELIQLKKKYDELQRNYKRAEIDFNDLFHKSNQLAEDKAQFNQRFTTMEGDYRLMLGENAKLSAKLAGLQTVISKAFPIISEC